MLAREIKGRTVKTHIIFVVCHGGGCKRANSSSYDATLRGVDVRLELSRLTEYALDVGGSYGYISVSNKDAYELMIVTGMVVKSSCLVLRVAVWFESESAHRDKTVKRY